MHNIGFVHDQALILYVYLPTGNDDDGDGDQAEGSILTVSCSLSLLRKVYCGLRFLVFFTFYRTLD